MKINRALVTAQWLSKNLLKDGGGKTLRVLESSWAPKGKGRESFLA